MLSFPRSFGRRLGGSVVVAAIVLTVVAAPAFAQWAVALTGAQSLTAGTLAAPTGVTAGDGGCVPRTTWPVQVDWTASSSTFADGYEIFRSATAGGPYTSVGTVNGQGTTTFTDTTTTFNTDYFYVVQAKRNLWRSPDSNEATYTTLKRNCN